MKLDKSFYTAPEVTEVARRLIGKHLCTKIDGVVTSGMIVETEAYSTEEKACHAYNNRYTSRTSVFFEEGGIAYVYLCYGIHSLFNIVTNRSGIAEAVLIRAVQPISGVGAMAQRRKMSSRNKALTSGPGKLSKALGITLKHNQISLLGNTIWLEDHMEPYPMASIVAGPRIGVGYAGADALLPWRFTLKDNPWLSG